MTEANKSLKEITDRLVDMYQKEEEKGKVIDRAWHDVAVYGSAQVKLYPDKTGAIKIQDLPKKKWWQFWKRE